MNLNLIYCFIKTVAIKATNNLYRICFFFLWKTSQKDGWILHSQMNCGIFMKIALQEGKKTTEK